MRIFVLLFVVLLVSAGAFAVSANSPNVWTGPLPKACTDEYVPVHDAQGHTYGNACKAALEGVRVTWNGVGD